MAGRDPPPGKRPPSGGAVGTGPHKAVGTSPTGKTDPSLRPPGTIGSSAPQGPRPTGSTGNTGVTRRPGAPTGSTTKPPGMATLPPGVPTKGVPPTANKLPGTTTRPPVSVTMSPPSTRGTTAPPPSSKQGPALSFGGIAEQIPKSLGGEGSLDEVERALSALDGRHENTERVRRETQAALAAKRAADEAAEREAIRAEKRNAVLKVVGAIVGIAAVGGGGWYGFQRYQRKVNADAALAPLAAPYLAAGWRAFPRPLWKSRHKTEALVGANTCVLALASTSPGNGHMVVERPSGPTPADTSIAFCTCSDERVVVHTENDQPGGVQLLFEEAVTVGGASALPFVTPRPHTLVTTPACPVDPVDAWISAGKGVTPPTAEGIAPVVAAGLAAGGWKLSASAPADLPFAVVPPTADSCFLATSTVPGEPLALREPGGERPLRPAPGSALAIAWCTHVARPLTVWHTGTGSVVVYRADAAPLGGTLGLREKLAGMTLGDVPTWVPLTERTWDASAALLISGVPSADIALPADGKLVSAARIVSVTLGTGHVAPVPDELDRYLCAPTLELSPPAALCVQSTGLAWKHSSGELGGIAEAPLPFWMDVMTQVEDHHGLEVEQKLLTLSRRLVAQHYEPTGRDGVEEDKDGVFVSGRQGDDRIIAIGVLSTPPYVLPYTEGVAWSLDGEPHSIPLPPGDRIHLTSIPWLKTPPDVRRTVVFRHKASQ